MTTRRYATTAAVQTLVEQVDDRDLAVLQRVSSLRFVSGEQLQRMHFGGHDAAQARAARRGLLRLVRLGALVRLSRRVGGVRAGSAGFVYRLSPVGLRLAEDQGWQPVRTRRRSDVPGTLFVTHALLVSELHTRLVEHDRAGSIELVRLVAEPGCWRSYSGNGHQAVLKPDSYLELGSGEYLDSYFIEVDRGTEGSSALARKTGDYLAYKASGVEQRRHGVFPRVLLLVLDEARAGAVWGVIRRLPEGARRLFAVALFEDVLTTLQTSENNQKTT
ncbi:MAG TPA: replication-relaxation family protein [Solirubrobacterales bacterium]|nr:replication-relaxation family protein [Solirubrobacterales bacterium]